MRWKVPVRSELNLVRPMFPSYKNQSVDLLSFYMMRALVVKRLI